MRMTMGILAASLSTAALPGQIEFDGSLGAGYYWTVEPGVYEIDACTIGGATVQTARAGSGLTWGNGAAVTPGEVLYISLSGDATIRRGGPTGEVMIWAGAASVSGSTHTPGTGGTAAHAPAFRESGGGNGGASGAPSGSVANPGGGGAGGYTGDGGRGQNGNQSNQQWQPGTGGAAAGGVGAPSGSPSTGGGGVGLLGIGPSGATPGEGGSGGTAGTSTAGGKYGGGAPSRNTAPTASHGAAGVRIMWGEGRSYPNNAGDV